MMADDDDIVVTIDDETVAVEAPPEDKAVAKLQSQFEQIKADKAAETTRREAAEQREAEARRQVEQARTEAREARTEVAASQLETVSSGLAAAQAEADKAEADYTAAAKDGDWAAAGKAQRRIATAEAKIVRLDEAKYAIEESRQKPAEPEALRTETRQPQQTDPVEQFLSTRTPPTAKWLREHRDWLTDPKKSTRLNWAHLDATEGHGLTVDSDEYFSHVETKLGMREAPKEQRQTARRAAPPAAPVNGSGAHSSGNGVAGNVVSLTKGEAGAATDGTHVWNYDDPSGQKKFKKGEPIGIQEMARRKAQMTREGKYDRSFSES